MATIDLVYLEPVSDGLVVRSGERDLNYPPSYDVRAGVTYGYDSSMSGTLESTGEAPEVAVFEVTDNLDGSGALVTLSSAGNGTTNNIYTCPLGHDQWTLAASLTEPASSNLPLSQGSYWAFVESVDGSGRSLTKPIKFNVSTSDITVSQDLRQRLRSIVLADQSIQQLLADPQSIYFKKPATGAKKPYIVYSEQIPTNSTGAMQYRFAFSIVSDDVVSSSEIFAALGKCLTPFDTQALSVREIEITTGKDSEFTQDFELILTTYQIAAGSSMSYSETTIALPCPQSESQLQHARNQAQGKSLSGKEYVYDRSEAYPVFTLQYLALNDNERDNLADFFHNCAKGKANLFTYTDAAGALHNVSFAEPELNFSTSGNIGNPHQIELKLLLRQ